MCLETVLYSSRSCMARRIERFLYIEIGALSVAVSIVIDTVSIGIIYEGLT